MLFIRNDTGSVTLPSADENLLLEKEMKILYGILGQFSVVLSNSKEKLFYGNLKNADFTFEPSYNSLRELTHTDKCGVEFVVWKELI